MKTLFHGGGLDAAIAEYGGKKADWLDLSTGINPTSYPVKRIDKAVWARLPDATAQQNLLDAARAYYGVRDNNDIVCGNGTQALLEILPSTLEAKHVAIVSPTYGEHAYTWDKAGVKVSEISRVVDVPKTADVLVVVNPNNPDTRSWQPADLVLVADQVRYLVVDEAFCDAYTEHGLTQMLPDNAIVLKSFGKFFGLAGLRLGFAISTPEVTEAIKQKLGPWSVSGPALEIGTRALQDKKWIGETIKALETGSKALAMTLEQGGLSIEGRNPLFVYAHHDKAGSLFKHLASCQILVRQFPDMPDKLRFGLCRNKAELKRLKKALKAHG